MRYEGKILPSRKHYARDEYDRQRLPASERGPGYEGLPGHGKVIHSTSVTVAHTSANQSSGDLMRRLNIMFTVVKKEDMPEVKRGKSGKDYTKDPLFVNLKSLPTDKDNWLSDGTDYSEDAARKLQSKIAVMAKAGAGTFKTSYRGGKVYIQKTADEYTQQRGG